ncbi:MAG: hypothetical protein WCV91_03155 [Candidatus Margulisiibacteriota bacterium]
MNKKKKSNNYYTEAFASLLIVGLGQVLKGEGEKGLKLILWFYFVLPEISYCALIINGFLFIFVLSFALILGFILWIYGIYDALKNETVL